MNTQHSQQTDMHTPSGIRTHNPSRRSAADPRLRPLGHWDRLPEISHPKTPSSLPPLPTWKSQYRWGKLSDHDALTLGSFNAQCKLFNPLPCRLTKCKLQADGQTGVAGERDSTQSSGKRGISTCDLQVLRDFGYVGHTARGWPHEKMTLHRDF
jgi:hypothetical protein